VLLLLLTLCFALELDLVDSERDEMQVSGKNTAYLCGH